MEKGIMTFKHNSRSKFSSFLTKLLATNCCTYVLKQYVKLFFKRLVVWVVLEHTQIFFLGRSQLRNQGEGAKGASAPFSQVASKI